MSNFTIAGIATIQRRLEFLRDTINSIIDQVDVLMIYFNDYDSIPDWLDITNGAINVFGSIEKPPFREYLNPVDQGDVGKFFTIPVCNGYYFSLDDDLIYPPDYIERMETVIDLFDRKAIITNHGRLVPKTPIASYYRDTSARYHFNNRVEGYHPVHIGGTGVMGFHTDTFRPDVKAMQRKFMADIYVADQAQDQQVPIIVQPHSNNWINQNPGLDQRDTIFSKHRTNDHHQTQLVNRRTSWQLNRIK